MSIPDETTVGVRRLDESVAPHQLEPGEYGRWTYTFNGEQVTEWVGRPPTDSVGGGCRFSRHQVTEHDDGTITVTPSILVFATGDHPGWHGFLERGVWRSV